MRAGMKSTLLRLACAVLVRGPGFVPAACPRRLTPRAGAFLARRSIGGAGRDLLGPASAGGRSAGRPPSSPARRVAERLRSHRADNAAARWPPIRRRSLSCCRLITSPARTSPTPGFPPTGPRQACLRLRRRSGAVRLLLPGACRGGRSKPLLSGGNRTARCARWISAARTVTCSEVSNRPGTAGGGLGDHRL